MLPKAHGMYFIFKFKFLKIFHSISSNLFTNQSIKNNDDQLVSPLIFVIKSLILYCCTPRIS